MEYKKAQPEHAARLNALETAGHKLGLFGRKPGHLGYGLAFVIRTAVRNPEWAAAHAATFDAYIEDMAQVSDRLEESLAIMEKGLLIRTAVATIHEEPEA